MKKLVLLSLFLFLLSSPNVSPKSVAYEFTTVPIVTNFAMSGGGLSIWFAVQSIQPEVIEMARAVDQGTWSTRTEMRWSVGCNCSLPTTVQYKTGSYWCCEPATENDRCLAGSMCTN